MWVPSSSVTPEVGSALDSYPMLVGLPAIGVSKNVLRMVATLDLSGFPSLPMFTHSRRFHIICHYDLRISVSTRSDDYYTILAYETDWFNS